MLILLKHKTVLADALSVANNLVKKKPEIKKATIDIVGTMARRDG